MQGLFSSIPGKYEGSADLPVLLPTLFMLIKMEVTTFSLPPCITLDKPKRVTDITGAAALVSYLPNTVQRWKHPHETYSCYR